MVEGTKNICTAPHMFPKTLGALGIAFIPNRNTSGTGDFRPSRQTCPWLMNDDDSVHRRVFTTVVY